MARPFVSGLYDPAEDASKRVLPPVSEIVDRAVAAKKKRLLQKRYSSVATPETKRITARMLGEKED